MKQTPTGKIENGKRTLQPRKSDGTATDPCLIGGGVMGELMRAYDWAATPIGEPAAWPASLKSAVGVMLGSSFPMFIWWGKDELINFYNDGYKDILGDKHPAALGKHARDTWDEIWGTIGPFADKVFKKGEPVYMKNLRLEIDRYGKPEEAYFTFSYSPIRGENGKTAGLFCAVTETTEDVLARQKLEESEERFRNLADTAPMYIAMADETGKAVYFNKPWLEFTGKKLEDMVGLGWLSVLHPDDAPEFEKDFTHAFTQHIPISKEYRFRRAKDGEYRWMLAVGAPRFTPDGHFIGYFGTYTDFHELKEAQLALQEREERFRTLIEKSADAVQLVSPEGKIIFSSYSLVNVVGYTPEEIADSGVAPFLHPDDRDYFFSTFQQLIDNPDKPILMQYRVKHKDGSWAWLETVGANHLDTPNIHALVGNFRNITKQKLAEDKLRNSESRFRALADNIPNLAFMAKADGSVFWYNNRWYDYTGLDPDTAKDWGWESIHDAGYLPKVVRKWKRSLRTGEEFEMVFPIKGADGVFRPFLTRIVPLRNTEGTIEQWIGTNTDISEHLKVKQAEARTEELEAITRQLDIQRNELIALNQAKDEFISLASHQLRTPATGVKQYLGMMLEGYSDELTPEQKEFAARAYESNEREITIINDLLSVAQVDAGRMRLRKKFVELVELIQGVLDEQAGKFAERQQHIVFDYPAEGLVATADEERMRMVLENIIDNASKYSPANTTIKVVLRKAPGKKITISVEDKGVGISAEDQSKIFDKFVRIDNPLSDETGGSGLGLYLVKRIVTLHDGSIDIQSTPEKGSVFSVTFPA